MKTPTPAGTYRVASIGQHVSKWKYPLSKIPWGTKLIRKGDRFEVDLKGKRQDVEKLTGASADWVLRTYKLLYKMTDAPTEWLFNDFGHLTVYLYVDKNKDGRWDRKQEPRLSEFIHTTPNDEAAEHLARAKGIEPSYNLGESHGCVHVRPGDIDTAVSAGYLKANQLFVVHPQRSLHEVPKRCAEHWSAL
ncbi:MAG: L,D-transpeptidase family protein [Myxococcales bacterium]|nr:L,D-transpeptidase family protein [Myxococcales bacterium]